MGEIEEALKVLLRLVAVVLMPVELLPDLCLLHVEETTVSCTLGISCPFYENLISRHNIIEL